MDLTDDQIAEARHRYALGQCPSLVAYNMSRFGRPLVTKEQVRAVIEVMRVNTRNALDPEVRAEAVRLYVDELLSPSKVAKRLGIAERTARTATAPVRRPVKRTAEADERRRLLKNERRNHYRRLAKARLAPVAKRIPVPEPVDIEVPTWVPNHLYEFFEATAIKRDEFAAAAAVRALLRGGSVAHL